MTDDKKPPEDFVEIDWDQALSEWDQTSFVPEVAKDTTTDKPAAIPGSPRTLYRPPTVSPAVRPKPKQPPPPPPRATDWSRDDEAGTGATVITRVPEEVLRDHRRRIAASALESAPRPPLPTLSAEDEVAPALASEAAVDKPTPNSGGAPLAESRTWPDEKPSSERMSATMWQAMEARAEWLEQEARFLADNVARARGLLACSEIRATLGDRELAHALAKEALDAAPSLGFAHQQARSLMPRSSFNCTDYVKALEAEARMTGEGHVRVHSLLLAVDALYAERRDDAAAKLLETAVSSAPDDVRAAVSRAADALGRSDLGHAALRPSAAPELAPIADAISTCLRLRGVVSDQGMMASGSSPTEIILRAREGLGQGRIAEAASLVAELAASPEIAAAAKWLAASLGATQAARRSDSARWLSELTEQGDEEARRTLIVRAFELGDGAQMAKAMGPGGPLVSAERVTLATLVGLPLGANDPHLDATASTPGMQALAAAVAALALPDGGDRDAHVQARAQRTVGSPDSRARVALGRLLSTSAPAAEIEFALAAIADVHPAEARVIALEMASRAGRMADVSRALEDWGTGELSSDDRIASALAAALVAERAEDYPRALNAFKIVRRAGPTHEAALRAIASLEQVDLVAEMNELADELGQGTRGAIARIEAAARGAGLLPEPTRAHMLDQAHTAAPTLPIASFLAERIARRSGDVDEVLRWTRERRKHSSDGVEVALDAVREALLIADREPQFAGDLLGEAHRARPNDVALRDLYERMSSESAEARAAWREERGAEAAGDARALFFLEAASDFELAGDDAAALRCIERSNPSDSSLGGIARERAELRSRQVARLAETLLAAAKSTEDARSRREAYERLAQLDATARHDDASALLWHRAILEQAPAYQPSLRHIEQHLIGEGRDAELEPIATAIAVALHGSGPGESTAHAELAARLRLRSPDARWDAIRDMVELAAGEREPTLWSLRMLLAQARSRGDDEASLAATMRLLDRTSRPSETAALLVRAGETASRLVRLDEARSLLERAGVEDPGDVVAWTLLADVCRRAGDNRGAAEACEALARSSLAPENRVHAWLEAGRVWLDEVKDEERAIVALEAAVAIDVAYRDVFDRLSHLYASRKRVTELASLLERRISGITDPDERVAMEVTRGRVLLEASDVDGARRTFQAVLSERPDDTRALSALADLCVSQSEWEGAEQALVQLTRLVPSHDEQRHAYARLGELYAVHLPNLSRAEVALCEVLKRAPDDLDATEKLVDVYKRQNDAVRALELQQTLISKARNPEEKRKRVVDLAVIHEQTAHDNRRAEQTLEAARREFPQDVGLLRALAEFYTRHHQAPAVNILLDRAGGDARRALTAGRVSAALFEVLATVSDLRGKKDGVRVTRGVLAAISAQPAEIGAGGHGAFDPQIDDLLAPEGLTKSVRTLLAKTGDALDQISPVDLRALKATPLPAEFPLARFGASIAEAIGVGAVQLLVSPKLGASCIPAGSSPPIIVIGDAISGNERFAAFLVLRALKLVHAKASFLIHTPPVDLAVLVAAWLKCFNPMWQPQGANPALVNAMGGRLQAFLPRNLPADIATIALEAAKDIGGQAPTLGSRATAWADRVALLALGDCNAALDAMAAVGGALNGAPRDPKERAAWVSRTPAARDLFAFSVSDAFAEARGRLGLQRSS